MNRNIDLTEINPRCMASIIKNNAESIYACKTVAEVHDLVKSLFDSNRVNTKASNRLLMNILKSKSVTAAQFAVTNSMLSGQGMSVI